MSLQTCKEVGEKEDSHKWSLLEWMALITNAILKTSREEVLVTRECIG